MLVVGETRSPSAHLIDTEIQASELRVAVDRWRADHPAPFAKGVRHGIKKNVSLASATRGLKLESTNASPASATRGSKLSSNFQK